MNGLVELEWMRLFSVMGFFSPSKVVWLLPLKGLIYQAVETEHSCEKFGAFYCRLSFQCIAVLSDCELFFPFA